MLAFRIYYEGGATYSGDAWDAPGLGVLVIVEWDAEHGRRLVTGDDFYVWRQDRWWGCNWFGLLDYLTQPGPRKVLVGRMTTNEAYRNAYVAADNDVDFPPRTGYGVRESRLTV